MPGSNKKHLLYVLIALITGGIGGCKTLQKDLFGKKSPHEQYGNRLTEAGLQATALGRLWFDAAFNNLHHPVPIALPYKETGYFAAGDPGAAGFIFTLKRGNKIHISIQKKPAEAALFLDLWQAADSSSDHWKPVAFTDTTADSVIYEIKQDGHYILRVQPELLKSVEYTLTVTTGPSLAYPIPAHIKSNIGSFWGASRDAGARRHEGIDIFAPFRTPALAAADGTVMQVNENRLGGKVVWLKPKGKNYTLYYAHLDTQMVRTGAIVKTGDTLGLTGNTGNAKYTPSHLHLGIYTAGGAVDPLPFVYPIIKKPSGITAPADNLGKAMRSDRRTGFYTDPAAKQASSVKLPEHTFLHIDAAVEDGYRVSLPNGKKGFVKSSDLDPLDNPFGRYTLKSVQPLYDAPDTSAPQKKEVETGTSVNILAASGDFYYVNAGKENGWITKLRSE